MSDVLGGRVELDQFRGLVACGGFSYGDVLGAGQGWAKSILLDARASEKFSAFFKRESSFSLGVCNGCQALSALSALIPGAADWPTLATQSVGAIRGSPQPRSRFEASPSIFFKGMEGSRLPIAVAHGEGYTDFAPGAARGLRASEPRLRALRRRTGKADRALPREPERLSARHHGPHHAGRPRHRS